MDRFFYYLLGGMAAVIVAALLFSRHRDATLETAERALPFAARSTPTATPSPTPPKPVVMATPTLLSTPPMMTQPDRGCQRKFHFSCLSMKIGTTRLTQHGSLTGARRR